MSKAYDSYLSQHKANVLKAGQILIPVIGLDWLKSHNLCKNATTIEEATKLILKLLKLHDASKTTSIEYDAYDNYFYPYETHTTLSKEEIQKAFDLAWLNHIHNNPHHWQYWILRDDDGFVKTLDMSPLAIIEMICDWMSFSIAKNSPTEFIDFFNDGYGTRIYVSKKFHGSIL